MKMFQNANILKSLGFFALSAFSLAMVGTVTPAVAQDNGEQEKTSVVASKVAEKAQPIFYRSGIDPKDLNTSVKPSDDFYEYAVGGWLKANPIPADQSRWGTFTILADNNTKILNEMLKRASSAPQNEIERKLGDFYNSGMDLTRIEREGLTPIRPLLNSIASIENTDELSQMLATFHTYGFTPYFELAAGQDDKDSSRIIAHLCQDGLGLPERDYYLRDDEKTKKIRAQYKQHLIKIFGLLGDTPEAALAEANAVIELETKLAKASMPAAEMRDPEKIYHLMDLKHIEEIAPDFNWRAYFDRLGLSDLKEVNVMVPKFLSQVNEELFHGTSLKDHRSYLRWNLARNSAPFLSHDMNEAHFQFYSKDLKGIANQPPRWKSVTNTIGQIGVMGFALGDMYVKEHFTPESKAKVEEIVANITKVMERDIPELTWMTEPTKKEALAKLHTFKAKIGYPEKKRDYSKLEISSVGYCENVFNASRFEFARKMATIGKPVDRTEWHMVPQIINAYYSPSSNEIVFPAGILQAPFFNKDVDDAANYGAIGAVIGHEISHGFDDSCSHYDAQGNMRNWWQPEDLKNFQNLAQGVCDQFSAYTVDGTHLNGKLVLGESIADLSGLALSWRAYQLSREGKEDEIIDDLTPAQRFFLSYAKIWATNMKPELAQYFINVDPHPNAKWRVNGPLSNMPMFFEAFNVKEGSPMRRPADKLNKIW